MWIVVQIRGIDGVVGDGERALDLALNSWLSGSNRADDPFGF
jgi:hypothetical protein